jgi:DNA-binding transcriptional MerR regulator
MKRRGNRRYYQHHEVLLIRRIRELLYDQGFTISGARNQLAEKAPGENRGNGLSLGAAATRPHGDGDAAFTALRADGPARAKAVPEAVAVAVVTPAALRRELQAIRALLGE